MSKGLDKKQKEHNKKVEELSKVYPDIPTEIFDIEASDEMASLYCDMFGD